MPLEQLEPIEELVEDKARLEPPRLQPIRKPWKATAVAMVGLFVLALFYTFYFAREFFLPLTLAWMFDLLLKPLVRALKRMHIAEPIGAGIVLIAFLALVIGGAVLVSNPASQWLARAPETLHTAGERARAFLRPAQKIQNAANEVEKLGTTAAAPEDATPKVELKKPGLMHSVVSKTTGAVFLIAETAVLLYFLLASGDLLMLKAVQALPRLKDKKRAVEIVREIERQVSRYLGAISIVNALEGTAIGIGLAIAGMPNPVLWGVMAALVNFIPYVGAMITVASITVVSLVTFDSIGRALLPPAIYLFINFSDNFLTPYVVGKRMVLNPLIVFLAVMFWGWIWGIVGVLLAVPITMSFKIFCDHFKALAPVGELLAGESAPEERLLHDQV